MGCFAARALECGELVGVYWGERLDDAQYLARHGGVRSDCKRLARTAGSVQAVVDKATQAERALRLERLGSTGPWGGADNRGAYVYTVRDADGKAVVHIDAEDPRLSSWCRYLNHANGEAEACTCSVHEDAERALVWFTAKRPVAAGEELCFDYGPNYDWGDHPVCATGPPPARAVLH